MVKNKATARLCCIFLVWSLSFFLSLSLADLALSRPVLRVSLSLTPFILRVPLDPASAGPRQTDIQFKTKFKKTEITASNSIASRQIEGEKVEAVTDFLFLGSKITLDGDCSHEIRRRLLLGRKVMTNLDRVLKSRDITLLTKVRSVKATVLPVVM